MSDIYFENLPFFQDERVDRVNVGDLTKIEPHRLVELCLSFDVKCVYFRHSVYEPKEYTSFDYKSTSLVVDFRGIQLPLLGVSFFASLRIETIVFILSDIIGAWRNHKLSQILKHVWNERWLNHNYHTTKIQFVSTDGLLVLSHDSELQKIETLIDRNKMNRRRCRRAASTFLSSGLKQLKLIDRDVCKLIARMIWQTRGTKVWSPLE